MDHELGEEARRLDEDPMTLIERFHGHVGPFVVLGYRSGRLARERLGVTAFKLQAEVFAGTRPPMSCFVDGVQLGSGCTLGKRNIMMTEGDTIEARFTTEDGRRLTVSVSEELLSGLQDWISSDGLDSVSEQLVAAPEGDLFRVMED